MRWIEVIFVVLLSGLLLTGCNSTTVRLSQSLIAEPLPVDYNTELRILRLNQLLSSSEIDNEQRARVLYDRGGQYDRLGLKSLARLDFDYAIRLKPDFAQAYSTMGIYYTLAFQFEKAYEAFDSANDLSPDYQFAYLSRGIALYYGGRAKLAAGDLTKYVQFDRSDPYRILWLYIVESAFDPTLAEVHLAQNAKLIARDNWAYNIIDLYLGKMNETQFLLSVTTPKLTAKQRSYRQCEAFFYLGKKRSIEGDEFSSADFYKLSLATNVYEFIEHKYARLELDIKQSR